MPITVQASCGLDDVKTCKREIKTITYAASELPNTIKLILTYGSCLKLTH